MRCTLTTARSRLAAWLRTPDPFDRAMPVVYFLAMCGIAAVAYIIRIEG
jgi:hypothetical protein